MHGLSEHVRPIISITMNVGTRRAYQDLFRLKVIKRPRNPPLKGTRRTFNPLRAVVTLRKLESLVTGFIVFTIVCWWLGERPVRL